MAAPAPHRDRLGLELTAASGEAARAWDDAFWAYVDFARDPGAHLKRTLELDPAMPMAQVLKGYFMHLMGAARFLPEAGAAHAAALAAGGTARERAHAGALGAWCEGELERTIAILEDILAAQPHDLLALKISNYLHFYLGNAAGVRDGPGRALAAWEGSMPGYPHLLALHAFGLEESGDYAEAERTGRRATDLNPADPWAVHSVAHVMEMQGRTAEGVAWIGSLAPHWEGTNFFRHHLWWHQALFHWKRGEHARALALYDARVWADGAAENLSLCNDVSLLARLELAGAELGERWKAAAALMRDSIGDAVLAFVDAHYALALGELPSFAGDGTQSRVRTEVGRALCEGLAAWRRGEYARAADLIGPVKGAIWRVGGSHAQRKLFALILADAERRRA